MDDALASQFDDTHVIGDSVRNWIDRVLRTTDVSQFKNRQEAAWTGLAELGVLSLRVPEEFGGIATCWPDVLTCMQQLGRGPVKLPVASTAVVAVEILKACADHEIKQRFLPAIAEGKTSFALGSEYRRRASAPISASQNDNLVATEGWIAEAADNYFVLKDDGLFLVNAFQCRERIRHFATIEGTRGAYLMSDPENWHLLASNQLARDAIEFGQDAGRAAVCAEALGAAEELLEQTIAFLKVRTQFGAALSSFQAIQHRVSDMFGAVEEMRSAMFLACMALSYDHATRRRALAAAKIKADACSRYVGNSAIQMHGGIGMSDDLLVGALVRRLVVLRSQY
jgi:alkylation response protein AidB-like acyl-CoA dehydrogenase